MCWINWFSFENEKLIQNMNTIISHRWPDGNWFFVNNSISMWQVRLSIIDLSLAWKQPLFYSPSIWSFYFNEETKIFENIKREKIDILKIGNYYSIIFNWEIYNFQNIKDDLLTKWYVFTSQSDTEVILAAYSEYGNDCHDLFNWMWAFCIYDYKNNNLIFSRDRFWIKPLYYHIDKKNNIIFSSEIKSILEYEWYTKKPNEEMIFRYLYLKNDTDIKKTFFDWIYKFPNAHYGIFDLGKKEFDIKRYWNLEIREDFTLNDEQIISKTRGLLFESIKLHKISDVEVWTCLSWWLDSSSIVCAMDYLSEKQAKIKTFSSIFKWDKADESEYIDIARDSINCESFFTSPTWENLLNDIEDLIYYQEEPFIGTSMYIQYKVMELANKNWIKVTLDWQWWDEVFGWYNTFYPFHLLYLLKKWRLISFYKYILWMKKYYSKSLFRAMLFPIMFLWYLLLPKFIKEIYLRKNNKIVRKEYINKYQDISLHDKYDNDIAKFYYFHQMDNIQHLLRYWDKNSMRWWVESRVPFLEKNLVEFLGKIPFDKKIPYWLPKNILRESMDGILPEQIKNRYDKKWFETPQDKRLKSENMKKYILNVFNTQELFVSKYIEIDIFRKILSDYFDSRNRQWSLIWCVLNLELWWRIYFLRK